MLSSFKLKQIYKFDPFDYLGPVNSTRIPLKDTKIQIHINYNQKQYGRYKVHMVIPGSMTGPNIGKNNTPCTVFLTS